jgi:rare lipoprotein A
MKRNDIAATITSMLLLIGIVVAHAEPVTLKASWYSTASLKAEGTWKHGEQKMANGRRFNENALTCAARLWPLGTVLRVTNTRNGKSVRVVVTDRIGKRFAETRVDLAKEAFSRIATLKEGVVPVNVEVVHG